MTTTKEDQMRAKYIEWIGEYHYNYNVRPSPYDAWKACAESYEKKLAEKDERIKFVEDSFIILEQQLSEANARNVRLEVAANTVIYCYDKRPENFAYAMKELKAATEENRAANKGKEIV